MILLELNWKPVAATHRIIDLDDTWTSDLSQTFDLVPVVSDTERASMRYLWKAASLHRHGERVWQPMDLISRCCAAMNLFCKTTQSARVVITRKSRQKSTVSIVAKVTTRATLTLFEARVGLTKPELRSFFLRGLTPASWLAEEPYEGPEVFLVADAIHDGFHFGRGTYFT